MNLARGLVKRGYEVEVITSEGNDEHSKKEIWVGVDTRQN
ncbi:MAG: hypothetical protein ACLFVX_04785 [Archaeoglobaceae archaeon]